MSSNAIVTLQFGHYSNFVGTHWWNIQENAFKYDPKHPSEINNDILYREGLTSKGETTFTPRLLLVDLKGSLKTLPEEGELYQSSDQQIDSSNIEIISEQKEEKNVFQKDLEKSEKKTFYNLDNEVQVWSDFLYSRFHPRTVNVIREYQHNSEESSFDIFPLGTQLWASEQFNEDFTDKIRNYVEECDSLQGFHVICDSSNGFSGLTVSCLEYLNDEYNSKSVAFPLSSTTNNPLETINLAFCYGGLIEHCSLFSPMSSTDKTFPFTNFNSSLFYHSSAILAASLDTATLVYRLKKSRHHLIDICSDLCVNGRKAFATSVSFPFALEKNQYLIDCFNLWEGPLTQSITPNCQINYDNCQQLVTLRGTSELRLKSKTNPNHQKMPAFRYDTTQDMLNYYLECTCFGTRNLVTTCGEQLPVVAPFPSFFDERLDRTGDISAKSANDKVEGVNVMAGWHSGGFVGNIFKLLGDDLEKLRFKKLHRFHSEGLEGDEFMECLERILSFRDCYDDGYLI